MPAARTDPSRGTLGTFAGVFTPSILTILGLILFLRLGYVVGAAGLGRALLILAVANAISILTSLSLSAVATNLRVKRGGDYYLISRTLGHEFGGAIGLVLFLAQAISIGFYCIGFAEVMVSILPTPFAAHPHLIAAMAAGLLFVFAWLGADWAIRFQYLVMTILVLWPRSLPVVCCAGTARCCCRTGRYRYRLQASGYCLPCFSPLSPVLPRG